jgi:hypothetical protein
MRRASRTDGPQPDITKALRGYGCLVWPTHMLGDGFPDLIIASAPRLDGTRGLGLMEIKDGSKPPSARKLTDDQIKFWDEWRGVPMAIVTDVDGALRFARLLAFETERLT